MEFFAYHRDRVGSTPLRERLVEDHWSYMDRFAAPMIARGPTYAEDGTLTGSVHILDLPDVAAARAFAFDEPCYQAGAYRDVLLRRWRGDSARTMWDFRPNEPERQRFLVLGFTPEPAAEAVALTPDPTEWIVSGALLSDDSALMVGAAVLREAPDADAARNALPADRFVGVEVHSWRFGGRPT